MVLFLTLLVGCTNHTTVEPVEPIETTTIDTTTTEMVIESKPHFELSDYERKIVECIVMGEARGESYDGKKMVAHCILTACVKDNLQPSQVRKVYKYSGWHENVSEEVKQAVSDIFDKGLFVVDDEPLYFYAPALCNSKWHETQRYICTIGCHKFFGRW